MNFFIGAPQGLFTAIAMAAELNKLAIATDEVLGRLVTFPGGVSVMGPEVTGGQPFWAALDRFALTQPISKTLFQDITNGTGPRGDDPITSVSWEEAARFVAALNVRGRRSDGWTAALPTAAQLEFVARGKRRDIRAEMAEKGKPWRLAYFKQWARMNGIEFVAVKLGSEILHPSPSGNLRGDREIRDEIEVGSDLYGWHVAESVASGMAVWEGRTRGTRGPEDDFAEWTSAWEGRSAFARVMIEPHGPKTGKKRVAVGRHRGSDEFRQGYPPETRSPTIGFRVALNPPHTPHK